MAKVTLNKDGKPRKKGSGKTKGAGCFTRVSWTQLQEYVSENVPIPISRVWLRELGVPEKAKRKASLKKPKTEAITENVTPDASSEEVVVEKPLAPSTESMLEPEVSPQVEPVAAEENQPQTEQRQEVEEEPATPEAEEIPEEEEEEEEEEELSYQVAVTPPHRYAQDFDL